MFDTTRALVAVVLAVILAGGCAGVALLPRGHQLHAGAERPPGQVAWIGGEIVSIDGRPATDYSGRVPKRYGPAGSGPGFEVLPGPHTVVIRSEYPHAARWMSEYTIGFDARPGFMYLAFWGRRGEPPVIMETASDSTSEFRYAARPKEEPVGRPVGRVEPPSESSEGQGRTWRVTARSASRIEPAMARRMFRGEGAGGGLAGLVIGAVFQSEITMREERTLAGESVVVWSLLGMGQDERWVKGHFTTRGYHLEVGVRLQHLGPDGEVPAPRAWLIGTGGIVLKMLAAVGVPKDSKPVADPALLDWFLSGHDPEAIVPDRLIVGRSARVKLRRLTSGESFGETVVRYYFQVPEGVFPDQLRLAVDDVPPLRLPPISRVY